MGVSVSSACGGRSVRGLSDGREMIRGCPLPTDTLVLACRLSGLTLTELWWDYVALGGNHSMVQLLARMSLGHEWPALKDLVLSAAADEALVRGGLPPLIPSSAR